MIYARSVAISASALLLLGSSTLAARQDAPAERVEFAAVFAPPVEVAGVAVRDGIKLRRSPNARAAVVAPLGDVPDQEFIRVSRISGEFCQVRYGDVEGWARLGDAVPTTMAVVLDPKTGATIARVPLGPGQSSVAFSPDGSRAIFHGCSSVIGDECAALELRTSDFAPTRAIRPDARGGPQPDVLAVFYGGPDGAPYAVLGGSSDAAIKRIAIVRVHEAGAPAEPPVLLAIGSDFQTSADGRVGFLLDPEGLSSDAQHDGPTFRVIDLGRLETRSIIRLPAERLFDFARDFAASADGSALFLLGDLGHLRILDVATGKIVREIPTGWATSGDDAWLKDGCSGGRSHLLTADGFAGDLPEGAWWADSVGLRRGPADVAAAADTGAARYGVDRDARRLYSLGRGAKASAVRAIARPDAGAGQPRLLPSALVATPNGARLILVLADPELM